MCGKMLFSAVRAALIMLLGLSFSFLFAMLLKQNGCYWSVVGSLRPRTIAKELGTRNLIVIGVMTADKFLDTRAKAVFETWGKQVPGKLKFFSSGTSKTETKLPVIRLPGVNDSYPPVKKSFMMMKYLHDNYINQYEWFMRADDDAYLRTDKLANFLHSLNSSDDIYLGHAGTGAEDEKGSLNLGVGENYCIGGPGVVLSRSVLKKVVLHVDYCLENTLSSHEDVELGRCVQRFTGVSCTWSTEMRTLFFHHYTAKESVFYGDLNTKDISEAITLHPVKKPAFMYRLHVHFMALQTQDLQHKALKLQRVMKNMDRLLGSEMSPPTSEKLRNTQHNTQDFSRSLGSNYSERWDMFTEKAVYGTEHQPLKTIIDPEKIEMKHLLQETVTLVNRQGGRTLQHCVKKVKYAGYKREDPFHGVQYTALVSCWETATGKRRITKNVHERLLYAQKPFGNILYQTQPSYGAKPTVHVVIPLQGRIEPFIRFMKNFEEVCLKRIEQVKLSVVYFPAMSPPDEHRAIAMEYQTKYPLLSIYWLEVSGEFSRGVALTLGAQNFERDALLFFCDVDLVFNDEFLQRCRLNSVLGKQAYFPIMFSLFNPKMTYPQNKKLQTFYNIHEEAGYWRRYSFGPACIYHNDFIAVGGFDLSIRGWGLEDIDFYEKVVKHDELSVFRARDPGLIHVYHNVTCDPNLSASQYKSCLGSRATNFASQKSLVRALLSKNALLP